MEKLQELPLIHIILKDGKTELNPIYSIPKDWLVSWENVYDYEGKFNIYDLKNNKLLLHSNSYCCIRKCVRSSPIIQKESKIYIINLNDFKVIYKENFPNIANIIVLNNCICIHHSKTIFIYSINDYKIVKKQNMIQNLLINIMIIL